MTFDCWKSLIDLPRLQFLIDQAQICKDMKIEGAVIEIGVYEGGSLARIAGIFPNKIVYGIDTFEGMPDPSSYDTHKKGDFGDVNFLKVKEWFDNNLLNVRLIKGFFPVVANQIHEDKFCFVHVDCDIYPSVLDCCKYFYPRLVDNGVMIFDDYGFPTTPGAKIAVDEYFDDKVCEKRVIETGQYFVRRSICQS